MLRALALFMIVAFPARACDTALVLAIDVSGSIDAGEYVIQTHGLADALLDPDVIEALLQGQSALAVVHWSGSGKQALVQPWKRMLDVDAVRRFSDAARAMPRAFVASDTAVGEAVAYSLGQFPAVADCRRKVIDISGDGPENAGFTVTRARADAIAAGVEINAIAIEDPGLPAPIAAFYAKWVITPKGFVMVTRGLQAYPETLRMKLLRELVKPVG